jgi:hypothetical protein
MDSCASRELLAKRNRIKRKTTASRRLQHRRSIDFTKDRPETRLPNRYDCAIGLTTDSIREQAVRSNG